MATQLAYPSVILALSVLVVGCASASKYNSLDVALLPCEQGDAPRFFHPIEFDDTGSLLYSEQIKKVQARLDEQYPAVTNVLVFLHGWNKNPASAEVDYQNFLCRLHGRLRDWIGPEKAEGRLLVLGIFWPSTVTKQAEEPLLHKPYSYYKIRGRADTIAEVGLSELFAELGPSLRRVENLHLIGHSFGGRMMVRSLERLHETKQLAGFLQWPREVNVVLLNAAVGADRFTWVESTLKTLERRTGPSYLFNVHSFNDSATRFLFPIASVFNDDPATCAVGACGVATYPSVCANDAGEVVVPKNSAAQIAADPHIGAWNVDATPVVFDHSDIYKGRVARLISDLLYDERLRRRIAHTSATNLSTRQRCLDLPVGTVQDRPGRNVPYARTLP